MDTNTNTKQQMSCYLHRQVEDAFHRTKTCFIVGCEEKPIRSHSIAESRLLKRISSNGNVLHMSFQASAESGEAEIVPVGKAKATTFPGLCKEHDREIFECIDNHDYVIGNKQQEFMFALRAVAREYSVRIAMDSNLKSLIERTEHGIEEKFPILPERMEEMKLFYKGFSNGTKELVGKREVFNHNLARGRYWKVCTETIEVVGEFPIVASSTFKLERDPDGKIVNLIHDLSCKGRPMFFTLFPQAGYSYCILSWLHSDRAYYESIEGLNRLSQENKKVIISNLLCSYIENFAVNPEYWNSLPAETVSLFRKYWGASSRMDVVPFIYSQDLSIFH